VTKNRHLDFGDLHNPHDVPRDPEISGAVGKRRAVGGWMPDENGNRGERRAAARIARQKARRKS
jgi:hypothetical protein